MIAKPGGSTQLNDILAELKEFIRNSPKNNGYCEAFLHATLKASGAEIGALWSVSNGSYRLEHETGLVRIGLGSNDALQRLHETALKLAFRESPLAGGLVTELHDAERHYRFFAIHANVDSFFVVEIVQENQEVIDAAAFQRAILAIGEVARDACYARLVKSRPDMVSHVMELQSMIPRLYLSMRLTETAYGIANEGRSYLKCDRLSVAEFRNGKSMVLAVSGVATIERRAKQIRELESLVTVVSRSCRPLCCPNDAPQPPEIEARLDEYLDASGCERIWILPILRKASGIRDTNNEDCIGAVIVENFTLERDESLASQIELFFPHASLAYRNAFDFESLPLRGLSLKLRSISRSYRSLQFRLLTLLCLAGLVLLLAIVVPADFVIQAQGKLQPYNLRHIYAPANGEIVQIVAQYQDKVAVGDTLLIIRSRELELRKEELLTERGIALEKLRGIEAARLRDRKAALADTVSGIELSANERELREVLMSQEQQLAILKEMIESLEVKSPVAGSIISWNPSERLERRPVQQGQKLMSVAALDATGWLELYVLDEDIRHVVMASESQPQKLKVSFAIASDPGRKHIAEVERIGTIVNTDVNRLASVQVEAVVRFEEMENAMPGARVIARIHCGRAPIGYVWTRRLWDFMALRLR